MVFKTLTNLSDSYLPKLSLRWVLLLSFIIQIMGTVGVVEWLSLRSGEKAAKSLAIQLSQEVSSDVAHYLEKYLEPPRLINEVNQNAIESEIINPSDLDSLGRFFWQQIDQFHVSYINFGTPDGELVGVERKEDGSLGIDFMRRSTPGILKEYQANFKGKPVKLLNSYEYDHRSESWYTDAVEASQPIWSEIYQWDGIPDVLAISASYPLYDQNKNLIGVLGVDQTISDLSKFLKQTEMSQLGTIFIIERSGFLVASSSQHSSFKLVNQEAKRIAAIQSQDPLIQETTQLIFNKFQNLYQINQSVNFEFNCAGEDKFVQVFPWSDELGFDWLIIIVLPESQFMGEVYAHIRHTILLSVIALVAATYIALLMSDWITAPIQRLSVAARAIANGELEQKVEAFGIKEVKQLATSFNKMTQQLNTSFNQLEFINLELEKKINQRTAELRLSEEKFSKAFRNSPIIITISTFNDGRFIEVNESFQRISGYSQEEVIGHTSTELNLWVNLEDRDRVIQMLLSQSSVLNQEVLFRKKSGEIIETELFAELIEFNGKICLLLAGSDITQRKRAEAEREMYENRLQFQQMVMIALSKCQEIYTGNIEASLQRITQTAAYSLDVNRVSVWFYKNDKSKIVCANLYELNSRTNSSGQELLRADYPIYFQAIESEPLIVADYAHTDPHTQEFSTAYLKPLGITSMLDFPLYSSGEMVGVICLEQTGSVRHWSLEEQNFAAYLAHMTSLALEARDRKQVEEQMQASLQEKEVLLREIHHRVKNNLHIISNLLDLQSDSIQDEKLFSLFSDSQSRIQSMALIHEQLYQSNDLGRVNFGEYIHRLVDHLFLSLSPELMGIELVIHVESIHLNIETAIPGGLLINELVTNSLKHAFPNGRSGKVTITLHQDEEQKLHLKISDDGIGIPPEIDWQNSPSLGLKLVHILSKQLRAKVNWELNSGTFIEMIFSELKYKPRF